jgi:hypothetical protein
MKDIHPLLLALALAGALNAPAQTAVPAFEFSSPGVTTPLDCGNWDNYGYEFNLTQEVEIVALGFYDHGQNGLTASHPVGLYAKATGGPWGEGPLLVRTNVTAADPLIGHFRYRAIAPLRLPADTGYRLSAFSCGDLNFARQVLGLTSQPAVSFVGNRVGVIGGGVT